MAKNKIILSELVNRLNIRIDSAMNYKDCPIGTKAHAVMGGWWTKTERGWKWCTGDTFPTPGGDVIKIELPKRYRG